MERSIFDPRSFLAQAAQLQSRIDHKAIGLVPKRFELLAQSLKPLALFWLQSGAFGFFQALTVFPPPFENSGQGRFVLEVLQVDLGRIFDPRRLLEQLPAALPEMGHAVCGLRRAHDRQIPQQAQEGHRAADHVEIPHG